ncbi:MAG TPA: hypothetical protein VN366_13130 [Feifaniaceae bacterium]|nr:hypothetical protein [Feifaniaceae bacterium]
MKTFVSKHRKILLPGLVALALLGTAIAGTLAWLTSTPDSLVNTFTLGEVDNEIWEGENPEGPSSGGPVYLSADGTKQDVQIKNAGTVDAYIRVALVPVWRTADGNGTGLEASLGQLAMNGFPGTDWVEKGGYYYYKKPVAPNGFTSALLDSATVNNPGGVYEGKHFELQIISQAIQAEGESSGGKAPVTIAWGDKITIGTDRDLAFAP